MKKNKEKPVEGMVIELLPSATFKVRLSDGEEIIAYLAGKLRLNYIKVLLGDKVLLELSPDKKRGRIIRRF